MSPFDTWWYHGVYKPMQNELGEEVMENVVDEVLRFEQEETDNPNQTVLPKEDKVQVVQDQEPPKDDSNQTISNTPTVATETTNTSPSEQVNPRIPIGRAAEMVGVSIDTLRRWDKSGKVMSRRSPGGHRYFLLSDLEEVFGTKYDRGTQIPANEPVEVAVETNGVEVEADRPNYVTEVVEEQIIQTTVSEPATDNPSFVDKADEIKIKNILEPMGEIAPVSTSSKGLAPLERAGIVGIVIFAIVDAILALLYFTGGNLISPLN